MAKYEVREHFSKQIVAVYSTMEEAEDRLESSQLVLEVKNLETGKVYENLQKYLQMSIKEDLFVPYFIASKGLGR